MNVEAVGWITSESLRKLATGSLVSASGTVPVHSSKTSRRMTAIYVDTDSEEWRSMMRYERIQKAIAERKESEGAK